MKQTELQALLGRPLTSIEVANLKKYVNIAREMLEDLTCMNLSKATEDRVYDVRKGYSTIFTDPFTTVNSVTVDGKELEVSKYSARQWDRRNAKWYNSIVVDNCHRYKEVTINADWGLCSSELELLLARLFGVISATNKTNGRVKSKKVEDFSISYNDNSVYQQFLIDNESLITKYSLCTIGLVESGEVCRGYGIR